MTTKHVHCNATQALVRSVKPSTKRNRACSGNQAVNQKRPNSVALRMVVFRAGVAVELMYSPICQSMNQARKQAGEHVSKQARQGSRQESS